MVIIAYRPTKYQGSFPSVVIVGTFDLKSSVPVIVLAPPTLQTGSQNRLFIVEIGKKGGFREETFISRT